MNTIRTDTVWYACRKTRIVAGGWLLPAFLFIASANAQVWNGNQFVCQWTTTLATLAMVQSNPITAVADLAFTSSSGLSTVMTGTGIPLFSLGDYLEVRDNVTAGNNGRYVVTGASTTTSLTAAKVVAPNPANQAADASSIYRQSQCDQRIDGKRRFITDIQWASSTISTAPNFFQLSYGTGLDCATTNAVIFTDYNPTTFRGRSFSLQVPIITPINTALCLIHPGGGTLNITLSGYAR